MTRKQGYDPTRKALAQKQGASLSPPKHAPSLPPPYLPRPFSSPPAPPPPPPLPHTHTPSLAAPPATNDPAVGEGLDAHLRDAFSAVQLEKL